MGFNDQRRAWWGDLLVACLLAAVLALGWSVRDWHQLSALRLPDTDDAMRLQQIRDWLGGQSFADLSQHRLGAAPGLAMHWSRLADLVPGVIIAGLTPLLGAHLAEIVAVIAWPTLLFAAALMLAVRIARELGGASIARTAAVVAAIAYPATTVFLPGRIDHHGLQVVLLLGVVRALVAAPTMATGLCAGFATAASLVVGLETMPVLAACGFAMAARWIDARPGADDHMMGFGIALGAGLLLASIIFRTNQWGYPACDGFTALAWQGGVTAAFAPMAMALAARDVTRSRKRALLGGIILVLIGGGVIMIVPECLHPYGLVDPRLATLWLAHVGEAQSLFAAPPGTAIGYAGVMLAGVVASAWRYHATRDRRWAALLVVQLAALALTAVQLRGAYAGAMLAAPGLASAIAWARARGAAWLAGAWLASAGMLYPIAAQALIRAPASSSVGTTIASCSSPAGLARLGALLPGRLLAPLDLGAYAIAATRLQVVGAPYHRNNAGNLAVYRFFLGDDAQAAAVVRDWRVDYVALCADSFAELPAVPRLAAALRHGTAPAWLRPIGQAGDGLSLYRVERRLFPGQRAL